MQRQIDILIDRERVERELVIKDSSNDRRKQRRKEMNDKKEDKKNSLSE